MPSRTAQAGLQTTGGIATETYADSVAGGCIGYLKRTSDQAGITGQVAISGVSVTVTVNPSRLIQVRLWISGFVFSDATTFGQAIITEGASILSYCRTGGSFAGVTSTPGILVEALLVAPAAGSHTYVAQVSRVQGTGTMALAADVDHPTFIMVNDLGPSF